MLYQYIISNYYLIYILYNVNLRDILNHRYFDKRRLYLLGLYQTLQKHAQKQSNSTEGSVLGNISFAAFKGDLRKAILVVQSPFSVSKAGSGGISLRIIPVVRAIATSP